ncbi:MAG: aryl-alcohol dehydrogenase-like predicted oxidoreductase [Flavobacterium sp.]|jgi:aryl-alcohol dehydrogenase-like predicted oxidoreductase
MIEKIAFGNTGHLSSRIIFGAAALGGMRQDKADSTLELVLKHGLNHFDVAASYGDAELRLAPFLQDHREKVFLATKTGDRTRDGAMKSIESSLQRMGIDQIDLIQFHNLNNEADWETVMKPGGALEAAIKAREQGLVKYIGVTGHGTKIAEMHLKSLAAFDFTSVLLPYSYMSLQDQKYQSEFEQLYTLCQEKKVAMQTIKAIARRRWRDNDESKKFSWYEPLRDRSAIRHAVFWVLSRRGLFLNSSSDATLLKLIFDAAEEFDLAKAVGLDELVKLDAETYSQEPLFIRGEIENVQ